MHRIAHILRRFPFIATVGTLIWQVGRPRFTAGVVAVVFNQHDEVLLVEHVFHPKRPWGLPGGWVDRKESLVTSITRELQEELQLRVHVQHVAHLQIVENRPNHIDIAYLCTSDEQVGNISAELLGYRWAPMNNLPHLPDFHYDAIQRALELRS